MSLQKIRGLLGRSNEIMLVVYAIFLICPHFMTIAHSHPGGDQPHSHPFQSIQEENLRKEVLVSLGDVRGLKAVLVPVETREEILPPLIPLEHGTSGLAPKSFWHTHFQEDPNLLALGAALVLPLILLALRQNEKFHLPFVPSLLKFSPIARGPPLFPIPA